MKIFSILVYITMVGIAIEICKAKYLLVKIDDAKKTGNVSMLNHTADLLKERKNTELAKENTRSEGECLPKDSDKCLQTSWGRSYTCASSTEWCSRWGKDMRRCCPEACNSGQFTEEECNTFLGSGTCIYPNDAQCPEETIPNCLSWRQTTFCSPNGDRDPINDKSCNEAVPDNVSGFCECREGVRTMQKRCKKGKFLTCNDACNIEWLTFMHIKREMYIGKPEVWTTGFPPFLTSWDSGNIDEHLEHAGKHMITDLDGNPHKLNDVKDGMMVKIVSKNIHFEGWQYLYTARHSGYCYYDQFRWDSNMDGHFNIWMEQQTWIVKIDYSNSDRNGSFRFESNYWRNKYDNMYLNANTGKWLYVDDDENPWWRISRA